MVSRRSAPAVADAATATVVLAPLPPPAARVDGHVQDGAPTSWSITPGTGGDSGAG
ncbi:hypothetical protein [Streptomyces sp. NPDC093970]|uniref:hypothetical protein n=1 Tax=Streptomyces sp. NPDC093970 TaxID=3155076 RepID=UPI00344AF2B5